MARASRPILSQSRSNAAQEANLATLISTVNGLRSDVQTLISNGNTLATGQQKMTQEIDDLNAAVAQLQATNQALASAGANAVNDISNLSTQLTALQTQLSNLGPNPDAAAVESAVATLGQINAGIGQTVTSLTAAVPAAAVAAAASGGAQPVGGANPAGATGGGAAAAPAAAQPGSGS